MIEDFPKELEQYEGYRVTSLLTTREKTEEVQFTFAALINRTYQEGWKLVTSFVFRDFIICVWEQEK